MLPLLFAMTTAHTAPVEIPLWPNGNPDGWHVDGPEKHDPNNGTPLVSNVDRPTVTVFPLATAQTGRPTIMVIPGGGYSVLAFGHEGEDVAKFLNSKGFPAAVLKYRLPRPQDPVRHGPAFQDGQRALRILRSRAAELKLDPDLIGVLGFSAGGHLSATLSTQYTTQTYKPADEIDKLSPKPAFTVLVYPAYLIADGSTNLKPEFKIDAQTPPAFFVHTNDDPYTSLGSIQYAAGLKQAGVPFELHVYPKGGHGYGLNRGPADLSQWPDLLVQWLNDHISTSKK